MKKLILPFLVAGSLFANDANLEITNHTLAISSTISVTPNEDFAIRGTYLYDDEVDKNNYYSIGFQAQGENALDNYNSRLNIFIDLVHTKDNTALPIGIGVYNNNFGNLTYPLFAKFELSYAPAVLSFDKADKCLTTKLEIGLIPINNAKLFVGYKKIDFDEEYQSVGYLGIGFIF